MFSGRESAQRPRRSCRDYLLLSRLYCRPRNYAESCPLFAVPISQRGNCHCPKRLVGFTTDREFTCTILRTGVTLPRRFRYSIVIYKVLRFDDAIYRTNFNALGGIKVTFTFNAGGCINNIHGAVAFGDGVGGTFGQACAASNTIFSDFHSHGIYSP